MVDISSLQKKHWERQKCYRLIPSKFPPIYLFEDVANEEEFLALYQIQQLTNPRIQEEIGNIALIPSGERLFGVSGSSLVMAAFTHVNPDGSRFSNGDYGIYYAAEKLSTAICETIYHREKFMRYTKEPAQEVNMRCLVAYFTGHLYDLTSKEHLSTPVYDKDHYDHAQKIGYQIKQQHGDGVAYYSVRESGKNINFGLFKANLLSECKQSAHYGYVWDGEKIAMVYEKRVFSPA